MILPVTIYMNKSILNVSCLISLLHYWKKDVNISFMHLVI